MTMAPGSWRRWQAIAVVAAILGLMLVGIRGEVASAGETAGASRAAGVDIVSFAFKPATLKIPQGSRVVFSNTSDTAHTATRKDGFDTGRIKPGKSKTVGFARKGTFAYHCSIHPTMNGTVVVKAASGGKPTTPATDTAALVAGDAGDAGPGVIALLGLAALGGLLVTLRRTARRERARA